MFTKKKYTVWMIYREAGKKKFSWDLLTYKTKKEATDSLILVRGVPADQWTLLNLYGLYITEHEKRFRSEWKMSVTQNKEVIHNLRQLVLSRGIPTAIEAVKAVFRLKWVTSTQDKFLSNSSNFTRFLAGEIVKHRELNGEQSEWAAERSEASGTVVEPKQFFKRV